MDEAFPGPSLQPADPRTRARMTQVCGIVDHYAYRPMIHQVFVPGVIVPAKGGTADQGIIGEGLAGAEKALDALENLVADGAGPACAAGPA